MDTPPKRRRRSFGFWAAVVLVVGGTLYPLSLGPAICLMDYGVVSEELLEPVYRPLLLLIQAAPPQVHDATNWYIALWARDEPPDAPQGAPPPPLPTPAGD